MLTARIAAIVLPLFLIVAVGVLYGRLRQPALEAANRVNLEVFVPALVFSALSKKTFALADYGSLVLCALCIVLLSGFIAWGVARAAGWSFKTLAPPLMFRNAGNMGLPLLVLALGEPALPAALVLFLIGNLTHFGLGTLILDSRPHPLRALTQPVLLAAVLALALNALGVQLPPALALALEMLGQISIPLMLFALGVRLASGDFEHWRIGLAGALLTPAIGFALALPLVAWFRLPDVQAGALLLFGALPPAVMNFLFAERYAQEPARVASIVLFGNLLSAATLPLALLYVLPRYG